MWLSMFAVFFLPHSRQNQKLHWGTSYECGQTQGVLLAGGHMVLGVTSDGVTCNGVTCNVYVFFPQQPYNMFSDGDTKGDLHK